MMLDGLGKKSGFGSSTESGVVQAVNRFHYRLKHYFAVIALQAMKRGFAKGHLCLSTAALKFLDLLREI
jgi:hypothetical protein